LAETYEMLSVPAAAAEVLARVRATAAGVVPYEDDALISAAQIATLRDDIDGSGAAVAAAYLAEVQLADMACESKRLVRDAVIAALINQTRTADARALGATAQVCTDPAWRYRPFFEVELVDHADRAAVAKLRAQITA